MTNNNIILTEEEKKLVCRMKKQRDLYKSTLFAGFFALSSGIAIQFFKMRLHDYLVWEAIYLIVMGSWTIIFTIRDRKIYPLMKRWIYIDEKGEVFLKDTENSVILTKREKRLFRFMERQSDLYKTAVFIGFFSLIGGIAIQLYKTVLYNSYLFAEGLFFIIGGISTVISNSKYTEIYLLIKKLAGEKYDDRKANCVRSSATSEE